MKDMTEREPYFWAKTKEDGTPGCSVCQHGLAAGAVAQVMEARLPGQVREKLPEGWVTLAAVHDVGKISPAFQLKCAQWKGPYGDSGEEELAKWARMTCGASGVAHPHAMLSELVLRHAYRKRGQRGRFYSACVGAHHGKFVQFDSLLHLDEQWSAWAEDHVERMERVFGPLPTPVPREQAGEALKFLLTGLIAVADWVASNEDCFPQDGREVDWAVAAERALDNIGLFKEVCPHTGLSWRSLFPHAPTPHPMQHFMWEAPPSPGVYIVEDSMGGGKTEAALGLAYHLWEAGGVHGIYFALPTQTTSNRLFYRMQDFLENCGVPITEQTYRLAHGNSWLLKDALYPNAPQHLQFIPGKETSWDLLHWFSSSRRTLLAPFGVGTVDQALMAVLAVKHNSVRCCALAGKVVILDEVHSYDMYTGTLIGKLVRLLEECGATVIILSATLTKARCTELLGSAESASDAYPLLSMKTAAGVSRQSFPAPEEKRIRVECDECGADEMAARACAAAGQGQCVLWIRNTVKDAQETYRRLQAERCEGGPEIGLLHARFPFWRREELENEWIGRLGRDAADRPRGCILVATQVVEQSIDIDADFLITDLAPTDMLLQRAGRLWRHKRDKADRCADEAVMVVHVPAGFADAEACRDCDACIRALGSSGHVYAPYVLLQTFRQWRRLTHVSLPADIRRLIEATYAEAAPDDVVGSEMMAAVRKQQEQMERLADLNASPVAGTMNDTEEPCTRYGGVETADVLLLERAPEMCAGGACTYAPLDGPPFCIREGEWSFEAAKSISRNVVKVPKWMLGKATADTRLEKYGFKGIFPCFSLANGDLKMYDATESGLSWHPLIGVAAKPIQPTPPMTTDENEFMF